MLGSALQLEWRYAPSADAVPPAPEVLRELLGLAAGGYPRALRARLEELRHEAPRHAAWVDAVLPLIDTDPEELNDRLARLLLDPRRS